MPSDTHPIEYISKMQDLVDLNDFMEDEDFQNALEMALKCIAKPDLPPAVAKKALIQMQAYSLKFRMMSKVYDTLKKGRAGTVENGKKNVYYSMSEQCHEMAQSLKYICKEQLI